jgi:hypothetical protein
MTCCTRFPLRRATTISARLRRRTSLTLILPWKEGGGSAGTLVWSTEGRDGRGIDAHEIEQLATQLFGGQA